MIFLQLVHSLNLESFPSRMMACGVEILHPQAAGLCCYEAAHETYGAEASGQACLCTMSSPC